MCILGYLFFNIFKIWIFKLDFFILCLLYNIEIVGVWFLIGLVIKKLFCLIKLGIRIVFFCILDVIFLS